MAVGVKLAVFWKVTPCSLVPTFRRDVLPPSSGQKITHPGKNSQLCTECVTSLPLDCFQLNYFSFLLCIAVFSRAAEFLS
jgi:hypothetical protein